MNPVLKIQYRSSSSVWKHAGPGGWHFISLPIKLSNEIRRSFKPEETGWGRLPVVAPIGSSEWITAIWFDTKKILIYFH